MLKLGLWWDPFIRSRICMSLNLQGSYSSWEWRMVQNLKRYWLASSKLTWWIWRILTQAFINLKKLHFNALLLPKVYNARAKQIQRSYVWWHWRLMQNLNKNLLVFTKMIWGIWQVFARALESIKIWSSIESFLIQSRKCKSLKFTGVMCHDNKERCKIGKGMHLSVKNWHEELTNFHPSTQKSQKLAF